MAHAAVAARPKARAGHRVTTVATVLVAAVVFAFSWLFRFNDPGGGFAGLTDDHFFYLVRGWQILFGDLPVRDFADHGAPLYYYVGWAVQVLFGRGTLSELAFSVTAVSLGAALTFWCATRASGSIVFGLAGAAFEVLLAPRFYNYPKILVYAVAIPLLWSFADRPAAGRRFAIALVTVIGFLLRHDHGVFVGIGMAALLVMMRELSWRERVRHAVMYGVLVIGLLAPYLLFIQMHGGVVSYFTQASAWAERDRERAPVRWPGLFENPDGVSDAARSSSSTTRAVATIRDNAVAWTFYVEVALPLLALALLAVSRDAFRPSWPHALAKIAVVAILGAVLDAGFLRSPLEARLADPSVPLAILVAWLCTAGASLLVSRRSLRPQVQRHALAVRVAAVALVTVTGFVIWSTASKDLQRRLEKATMTGGVDAAIERAGIVADEMRTDWNLRSWESRPDRSDLIGLSLYLNACTVPSDRVFVESYVPQVLALARRAFAGGHADLRLGLFDTPDAQRLTIERLQRQSVPVMLFDSSGAFRSDFPIVTAYIDQHYRPAATRMFDGRFGFTLYVRRDLEPRGTYEPFGWPCYGSGQVAQS